MLWVCWEQAQDLVSSEEPCPGSGGIQLFAVCCWHYSCSAESQGAVISFQGGSIVLAHVMVVICSWQHRAVSSVLTPQEEETEALFVIPVQS